LPHCSTPRFDAKPVRLAPKRLEEIVRRTVVNLLEHRLGRIAEWNQPRYALYDRQLIV
jgi:hypothetical protein